MALVRKTRFAGHRIVGGPLDGKVSSSAIVVEGGRDGKTRNVLHVLRDGFLHYTGCTAWVKTNHEVDTTPPRKQIRKYPATTLTPLEQKFVQRA